MKNFDDYFWPNQNCLKNKLNIHNQLMLDDTANALSMEAMDELLNEGTPSAISSEYLKHCHKTLFQDVYDWAGEYRECEMSRNIDYAKPDEISDKLYAFCKKFNRNFIENGDMPKDKMADVLADSWAELNKIHAFRDGNGRSQYVFFNGACLVKDYKLMFKPDDIRRLRDARDAASDGRSGLLRGMIERALVQNEQHELVKVFRSINAQKKHDQRILEMVSPQKNDDYDLDF